MKRLTMAGVAVATVVGLAGCGSGGGPQGGYGWSYLYDDPDGYAVNVKCDGTTRLYIDEAYNDIAAVPNAVECGGAGTASPSPGTGY